MLDFLKWLLFVILSCSFPWVNGLSRELLRREQTGTGPGEILIYKLKVDGQSGVQT